LYAGFPFAEGVASASPEIAKRTEAAERAAGAVANLPIALFALPCAKTYW
jgi:hypothetical protein